MNKSWRCDRCKNLVAFTLHRLDIGDGKDVDLKDCPISKLRQQCIKYLGPVCSYTVHIQIVFTLTLHMVVMHYVKYRMKWSCYSNPHIVVCPACWISKRGNIMNTLLSMGGLFTKRLEIFWIHSMEASIYSLWAPQRNSMLVW